MNFFASAGDSLKRIFDAAKDVFTNRESDVTSVLSESSDPGEFGSTRTAIMADIEGFVETYSTRLSAKEWNEVMMGRERHLDALRERFRNRWIVRVDDLDDDLHGDLASFYASLRSNLHNVLRECAQREREEFGRAFELVNCEKFSTFDKSMQDEIKAILVRALGQHHSNAEASSNTSRK